VGSTPEAFKDPAKGKAIAISQASAGADVIYHAAGASGRGVFEGAREAGAVAIGVDADQYDEMPGYVVTSMVKRMDVTVYDAIKSVIEGRFEPGMHVFGLKEQGLDWVHDGPHARGIPEETRDRVEALRRQIVAGTIHVPVE
jgi:basic membrane protein A